MPQQAAGHSPSTGASLCYLYHFGIEVIRQSLQWHREGMRTCTSVLPTIHALVTLVMGAQTHFLTYPFSESPFPTALKSANVTIQGTVEHSFLK